MLSLAYKFIAETNMSVFLTGKAGTGKTTFLRQLKDNPPKRMAVVAPTGVAAINAQGMTIHSFFQLPLGPHVPGMSEQRTEEKHFKMSKEKKNILRTLDLLVIDEISMVRCDLLDYIDEVLRKYKDREKPFGGVQLLMIGDLQQLAPVAKESEWEMLRPFYQTPYFFGSKALSQIEYVTIELTKIYRQTDAEFISLLSCIRDNRIDPSVLQQLNSRYIPDFSPSEDEDWIRLTTHNKMANDYNEQRLAALPGKEVVVHATVDGNFPESAYPADEHLRLKEGAQVMFLRNDTSATHQYYNGKIGVVTAFNDNTVTVMSKEDGSMVELEQAVWENMKYVINPETKEIEETQDGTYTQFPLRLAWAITVHKSQGLTFEHAVLDINDAFAHGQTYVALSRCRTLEGLVLARPFSPLSVITDESVNHFIDSELARAEQAESKLADMQYQYFVSLLTELFTFSRLYSDFQYFTRVVNEHIFKSNRQYADLLVETLQRVDSEIVQVAGKFRHQYQSILYTDRENYLTNTRLYERIHSAAEYFTAKLLLCFTPVFEGSSIAIENKTVKEQFNNALDALTLAFKIKIGTLSPCVKHDFTVRGYLSDKAKAALYDMEIPDKRKRKGKGNRTKSTEEKPKPAKADTRQITYNLYLEGNGIKEIATLRNLRPQTIEDHLAYCVRTGMISVDDLMPKDRQIKIRRVLDQFERGYTLSDVKAVLPDSYTYAEIKYVIAAQSMD